MTRAKNWAHGGPGGNKKGSFSFFFSSFFVGVVVGLEGEAVLVCTVQLVSTVDECGKTCALTVGNALLCQTVAVTPKPSTGPPLQEAGGPSDILHMVLGCPSIWRLASWRRESEAGLRLRLAALSLGWTSFSKGKAVHPLEEKPPQFLLP